MTPSIALRLQSMMRSMQQSILPALDRTDSLAQEQAKLLMGHIQALQVHVGNEQAIDQIEHEKLRELAQQLLGLAEGGENTQDAVLVLNRALQANDPQAVSLSVEALLAAGDASESFRRQSWELTLGYAEQASLRGKDWFRPMGF